MFNHISIFKKGAVLIAVPLLVQCAFLGLLINAQSAAAKAQKMAMHTKIVIAQAEQLYREVIESRMTIRDAAALGRPAPKKPPGAILDKLTASIVRLCAEVSDNPPQQRKVDRVGETIGQFGRWVDELQETEPAARDDSSKERLNQEAIGVRLCGRNPQSAR